MDWNNIGSFFKHGLVHVLQGWDHLLFASALVLALTGFWEIFKVVGAFTLAHSLTAALTVMKGAPLIGPSIVEPCIAGSIIYVALENVLKPNAAQSKQRLLVAFGFGLVHGMGLAGPLLENLAGLSGAVVAWAVIAFCVGVEVGHLCVVAPLSGILKIGRDQGGETFRQIAVRYGSLLIAIGGVYYLLAALNVI
jgi:hypothetical protein